MVSKGIGELTVETMAVCLKDCPQGLQWLPRLRIALAVSCACMWRHASPALIVVNTHVTRMHHPRHASRAEC